MKNILSINKVILEMAKASAIWSTIQTFLGAYLFMLIVGVVHTSLSKAVIPMGYWNSLILMVLVEALIVVMRLTVDYREAFYLARRFSETNEDN